jgi:hypothetical protein
MASDSFWTPSSSIGPGNKKIRKFKASLVVPTALTTITVTTPFISGKIKKVHIKPGDMATSATLKGFDADSGQVTPEYFLDFTFPASQVERIIYPALATLLNTGEAAVTARTVDYVVCGRISLVLASAVAADSTDVTIYVECE